MADIIPPTLILELRMNPAYISGHRFEKALEDSPWRGAIRAIIELDDLAWELLGYPNVLQAHVKML